MNLYINPNKLKIGDKLFDVLHGEVIITNIRNINTDAFCKVNQQLQCQGQIINKYGDIRYRTFTYTLTGKQNSFDQLPRLYKSNPFINN